MAPRLLRGPHDLAQNPELLALHTAAQQDAWASHSCKTEAKKQAAAAKRHIPLNRRRLQLVQHLGKPEDLLDVVPLHHAPHPAHLAAEHALNLRLWMRQLWLEPRRLRSESVFSRSTLCMWGTRMKLPEAGSCVSGWGLRVYSPGHRILHDA